MSKLFISHGSKDDAFVRDLRVALADHGQPGWIDSRELRGGDPLWSEIIQAIDDASAYAVVISNYALQSKPLENAIRPICLKRNWRFAGSEAAGKRAAVIQSLLQTARLNGSEPMAWLTDALEKLPNWPNSRIDELLPIKMPG